MAEPILSVRGLKTWFRQDEGIVRAVDGTSFDLEPGRTLGILLAVALTALGAALLTVKLLAWVWTVLSGPAVF
jgi:ABC-type microcin C transport system duplicated ATPase subunit YejF